MKKILFATFITAILAGCSRNQPLPSGRLTQPAADFSFITPEGWFRNKLAGINFIIVSTKPDHGMKPNIFVDFINPTSDLDPAIATLINAYENNHQNYVIIKQVDFKTRSGLHGIKITALRKNKTQLPVGTYHYLIQGMDRVFVITCTCAEAVKEKYEPVFDQAIHTLETKNK